MNWKTPSPKTSVHDCLKYIEVGRKKSILSGFRACKSVFFGRLMRDHNRKNLFLCFRSFLNVFEAHFAHNE